jgi:hypothetical protein
MVFAAINACIRSDSTRTFIGTLVSLPQCPLDAKTALTSVIVMALQVACSSMGVPRDDCIAHG